MGISFLPGLWVLALAALLVWVLRRWFDPVRPVDLLAYAVALVALFGPVLFAGDSLLPLDNLRGEVPFRQLEPTEPHGNGLQSDLLQLIAPAQCAVRASLSQGRWPAWSARMGAGMPLLADPQAQALQPLTWVATGFEPHRAAGVTAALKVFLTLCFTGLWLRRQGLSGGVALVGSLAWGLGGFLLLWLGWPLATTAAWLPAVLYGAALCQDREERRDGVLLALALAGLLLAGHPQTIAYALLLTLVVFWARRHRPPWVEGAPRAGRAGRQVVLAAFLALSIAAPAWLPAALYAPQTLRADRITTAQERLMPPAGERAAQRLLPIVAPSAFGNDRFVHYWGNDNINEDASGFVGTVCLLLVALSGLRWVVSGLGRLGSTRSEGSPPPRHRRPQEGLMAGVAAFCLLVLALPPGLPAALRWLPGGAAGDFHHRLLLPLGFALMYLAVCELERWCGAVGPSAQSRRLSSVFLAAALLGLATLLAWAYLAHPSPDNPELLEVFRLGWLRWQLRFLGAAAALLFLAGWVRGAKKWLPAGLALLVMAELLLLHRPANPPMPERLAFPATPPLSYLQEQSAQAPEGGPDRLIALGRALPANLASVYGLADLRTAGPMAPAAVHAALAEVIEDWQGEAPIFSSPEHEAFDSLGVRWVLAEPGLELAAPLRPVLRDPTGWVWERPNALPLLRLAGTGGNSKSKIEIELAREVRWHARYSTERAERLSTGQFQDGGWRVLVDGRRVPSLDATGPAAGPFLEARLPAGKHDLDLIYRAPGLLWGCILTGLGWALLLTRVLRPDDSGQPPG